MPKHLLISILIFIFIIFCTLVNSQNMFSRCEIWKEFELNNVPMEDRGLFLCMAEKASGLEYNLKRPYPAIQLSQTCTPFRFGIFQLTSESCIDNEHGPDCKTNICHFNCQRFLDRNLRDDIKCLRTLLDLGDHVSYTNYKRCSDEHSSFNITTENHICMDKRKKDPEDNTTIIAVCVSIVMLIGFCILGAVFWIRTRNSNTLLTKQEINDFKYGFRGHDSKTASKRKNKLDEETPLRSPHEIIIAEQEDVLSVPYDKRFEIMPNDYEILEYEILGTGAYGVVRKAKVKGQIVAVKSSKPNGNKDYLISLLEEIKVMSYLGTHPNILSMLGASTRSISKGIVYIFLEFCPLGSLEGYLRSNRNNFVDLQDGTKFRPASGLEDVRYVDEMLKFKEMGLSSKNLIKWSYELACGMNYLSSRRVIHADLACRNILLVDRDTIKISDFGLSRKLYSYCNYIKSKEEPLPWRWMAIESLRDMAFSTSSDVWAFGVTIWEIFSLGDTPFPGKSWTVDFLDTLISGLRMNKPRYATKKLYEDIMCPCWNMDPEKRPSFKTLQEYFRSLLESVSSQNYASVADEMSRSKN